MAHLSAVSEKNTAHKEGQQHPIKLYLVVWGWLFVLSTCSFLVDYFGLEGFLKWFLILLFMIIKAGLIVAVFMHMAWERWALMYAILVPPGAVLLFVAIMAFESDYTHFTRLAFFATGEASAETASLEPQKSGSRTGTATAPPDQLKNDVSKPEVASEERDAALSGSASEPKEAEKTASATGNPAAVAAAGEAEKTVPATGNPAAVAAVGEAEKPAPATGNPAAVAAAGEAEKPAPATGNPAVVAAAGEAEKPAPATGNPAAVAATQHDDAAAAKALEAKFYTLKPGDTLWKIAEIAYGPGHGGEYHLIFEANKSLLSDPGKIYPGQVLRIPPLSG